MDAQLVEATIKTYLTEIRSRLDKAAGIGRAADAGRLRELVQRSANRIMQVVQAAVAGQGRDDATAREGRRGGSSNERAADNQSKGNLFHNNLHEGFSGFTR
jgi:hypothetical protein